MIQMTLKYGNLKVLNFLAQQKNYIIHLQPISQLNTLVSLNINFNKVYDLNPLTKLQKLEELYATNNEIKTIEPLKQLKTLKILQVYKNGIQNMKQTFQVIINLPILSELDIEQNPVAQDQDFISLISSTFSNIKKINNELNKSSQKIKQMSCSKGFVSTSTKGFGATSMIFNGNTSSINIVNGQKTFYNFCKQKTMNSNSFQKRKEKQNILQKLQNNYRQLDEEFENQIVKNVQLKNRLYKLIKNKKEMENQKKGILAKTQQTKQLKRKVKTLKQQLFTKDKKGQLLKKLFKIQLLSSSKQQQNKKQATAQTEHSQSKQQKLKQAQKQIRWNRKFEADEVFVIQSNEKHVSDQTYEINQLLSSIDSSIQQLKRDIDYLS